MKAIQRADVVLLVIDATEPLTAQDVHLAGFADEATKGLIVVINKWDLIERDETTARTFQQLVQAKLKFAPYARINFTSALYRQRIPQLLRSVDEVMAARLVRIPTPQLNELLQSAQQRHHPAAVRGKMLKVYYGTQTGVNPPVFQLFCNDPALLHFSYQRYLENQLRARYGFEGTALKLVFRKRGD
jgi:GTP-binding protein